MAQMRKMKSIYKVIFSFLFQLPIHGCAIYYYDASTGAEHIWGVGHLATKITPPADGKQAILRQATLTGFSVGIEEDSFAVSLGRESRERMTIYNADTLLSIENPNDHDIFLYRIGSFPKHTEINGLSATIKSEKQQP